MAVRINFEVDIKLEDLNPIYLPYVDWGRIDDATMQLLPPKLVMFAPISRILGVLINQNYSKVSDEDVLSVVARSAVEISKVKNAFGAELRLNEFLNKFPSTGFVEKYYRQILALHKMYKSSTDRLLSFLAIRGLVPFEVLYETPYYLIDHQVLMSPLVDYDIRKKIFMNSNYYAYKIDYDLEVSEFPIVLKSADLVQLNLPEPKDISSAWAVNFNPVSDAFRDYRDSHKFMEWDILVDMYLSGDIKLLHIQYIWEQYCDYCLGSEFEVKNNDAHQSEFREVDFK